MVFYYLPRKRQETQPAASDSLASLPDEILLEILKHADTDSITKFRLTCSTFAGAGNSALQARLKTLYIHSTIPSLRRAVAICEHPLLSRDIEELVLLDKSLQDHYDCIGYTHHLQDISAFLMSMV